jgi:F-type H+-transporting ATPase subunit b
MLALALLAAEAESPNPIMPAANELFWGVVSFGGLYLLVRLVLLHRVERVVNDRRATVEADRAAAERARARAAALRAERAERLAGHQAEAAAIVDDARAEAEAARQRLVARAMREAEAMRALTTDQIEQERTRVLAELGGQVAELAAGAAERIMKRPATVDVAPGGGS